MSISFPVNESLFVRGLSFWNSIPAGIRAAGSVASFRAGCLRFLRGEGGMVNIYILWYYYCAISLTLLASLSFLYSLISTFFSFYLISLEFDLWFLFLFIPFYPSGFFSLSFFPFFLFYFLSSFFFLIIPSLLLFRIVIHLLSFISFHLAYLPFVLATYFLVFSHCLI